MILGDAAKFVETVNKDPEFNIAARFWNSNLKVGMGEKEYVLKIQDGKIVDCSTATLFHSYDIEIKAPEDAWNKFLQAIPQPFYHDILPAVLHHEFSWGGDVESIFAYYPAIRRMFELLRLTA